MAEKQLEYLRGNKEWFSCVPNKKVKTTSARPEEVKLLWIAATSDEESWEQLGDQEETDLRPADQMSCVHCQRQR